MLPVALVFLLAMAGAAPAQEVPDSARTQVSDTAAAASAAAPFEAGPAAFKTSFGAMVLLPAGGGLEPPGHERPMSGRITWSTLLSPRFGMHFGGLRLAVDRFQPDDRIEGDRAEQLAASLGIVGFRLNLLHGRVRLAPFLDIGAGRVEALTDAGGYVYEVDGGTEYRPRWQHASGPFVGGGAGVAADLIIGPGLTLSALAGRWHFVSPRDAVEPLGAVFMAAGLRLYLRDEPWYWRTSGRDADGPVIAVVDPAPDTAGVIDVGRDEVALRLLASDLSGIDSVLVNGRRASLRDAGDEVARSAGAAGAAVQATVALALEPGPNRVQVVAYDGAGNALDRTLEIHGVPLDRAAPAITILSPADDARVDEDRVELAGVAVDASVVSAVTVNGMRARVLPASAADLEAAGVAEGERAVRFEATVPLRPGENLLEILAADSAANQGLARVTVHGPAAVAAQPDAVAPAADARPIIQILEPREWSGPSTRGITVTPRRSLVVRGIARYPRGIAEVRINGDRAAVSLDATGTMATFSGFVPVTAETREVEIVAWGTDRVPTSELFPIRPGMPPSGPAEFGTFADATERRRWAVVIGISDYADPEITDLEYADDDARAVYDFLRSDAAGLQGIPEENIRLLVDEEATQRAIRSALLTFLRRSTDNDVIVIYIAAHGMPDPQRLDDLYLLAYDTELADLAATGVPMSDVHDAVEDAYAYNKVVITDACHSAGVGVAGGRNVNLNPINAAFVERINSSTGGYVAFTASETNQLSHEGEQWGGGHGVFTHYLLEGLRGGADTDGDDIVTLGEMMEFTRERVRRATENAQIPMISPTNFDRYWPMSIVPEAAADESTSGGATGRPNAGR